MLDLILSFLAPFPCVSCGRIGPLLCDWCVVERIESRRELCIGCGQASADGLCAGCAPTWPVERALVFDERADVLETLINEFKYSHKRAAAHGLARLAASLLPYCGGATIVPIPTIAKHVRQRGYDHMSLLARTTARISHLDYVPILVRQSQTVQHGASKHDRIEQARGAFKAAGTVHPNRLYILFDDITTTGASLKSAAKVLRDAGARRVWAVALARQPLDSGTS